MANTKNTQKDEDGHGKFQWHCHTPGLWERNIDEAEQFYSSVAQLTREAGAGCFLVTACVNLRVAAPENVTHNKANDRIESAIRKAWLSLRYEYPTLASWTEYDGETDEWTKFYSPLSSLDQDSYDEQQRWLSSTLITIDSDMTGIEWLNDDPPLFGRSTVYVLRPYTTCVGDYTHLRRTLLLRCPHEITDGIGILHLLKQLVAHAARAFELEDEYTTPVFGHETKNLSLPLRIAASLPAAPNAGQCSHFDALKAKNTSLQTSMPLLGLPLSAEKGAIGKRQYMPLSLSNNLSARVLSECKARGISVTHAFSAALILVLRDVQPQGEQALSMRYYNHALINLRHVCQPPYNTEAHAAAVYHMLSAQAISVDVLVPALNQEVEARVQEFAAVSDQVRSFFASARGSDSASLMDLVAVSPLMWASMTPPSKRTVEKMSSPAKPEHNAPPLYSPVSISSIGNITSIILPMHGALVVSEAWVAAESMGPGVGLFLGTYEATSTVVASFDSNWHSNQYMGKFLERIVKQMVEGLGLNEEG
ncbi:hypothetical protein G7Z17_g7669 [Cylindrodendrum hubeiense]|uniref:Uncharacterized protein n=1 Tax=Cylindrodendrum hubeiense TaxID=595255 RepID=A0A9P5HA24_9HYPO|nr:hypothetical protein G7Z17_g7669 [Cylindrodendrum hubeiense]